MKKYDMELIIVPKMNNDGANDLPDVPSLSVGILRISRYGYIFHKKEDEKNMICRL